MITNDLFIIKNESHPAMQLDGFLVDVGIAPNYL